MLRKTLYQIRVAFDKIRISFFGQRTDNGRDSPLMCDLLLFGGAPYTEPIAAEGPFVMNSELEIAHAYKDFYNGKYGKIDYEKQKAGKQQR